MTLPFEQIPNRRPPLRSEGLPSTLKVTKPRTRYGSAGRADACGGGRHDANPSIRRTPQHRPNARSYVLFSDILYSPVPKLRLHGNWLSNLIMSNQSFAGRFGSLFGSHAADILISSEILLPLLA